MSADFVICPKCGGQVFKGQWPSGFCSGDPSQHARPTGTFIRGNAQSFTPVVYFENARGERKYPGRFADAPPPGFVRRELTNIHEVRKFQRVMDTEARIEHEVIGAEMEKRKKARQKERRERMFRKLNDMGASQAGIDFAKAAVQRSDSKPKKRYEPGSFIAPFEYNKSNVAAQAGISK